MKKDCDFYYKCMTPHGLKYYGIKMITTDQKMIDLIIDQINAAEGAFVKKKEFDLNTKNVIEAGLMDNDNGTLIVAKLFFDGTGLIKNIVNKNIKHENKNPN